MKKTKEDKLDEITDIVNQKGSLYFIHKKDIKRFEGKSEKEGKGTIAIMTYGDYIVYLRANNSDIPKIALSKFNYTNGTFEKKWGEDHKTIVLTPNHSSIRKVSIEIQGMNIHKMKLLPDKSGDVFEDTARVKITRYYRFEEGASENEGDSVLASPGKTKAKLPISASKE